MNPKIRVVNTAPLIFLAKLGRLELLRLGTEFVYVPPAVLAEIRAIQDEATHAAQEALDDWLIEKACTQPALIRLAMQAAGPGEAEVIALAIELDTKDVVLDDLDARRFARRVGLEPIGTLGLLLAAKGQGIIVAVAPEVETLRGLGFRVSETLLARILAEAGEQSVYDR